MHLQIEKYGCFSTPPPTPNSNTLRDVIIVYPFITLIMKGYKAIIVLDVFEFAERGGVQKEKP
jgi:hypothetical protein